MLRTSVTGYRSLDAAGEVDDGDVGGRYAESHSGEFAVEARNHFADGLGGSGRRRDDVGGGRSTAAPVLVARPVDRLLRGRVRVHGRHQALDDVVLLVDHFGQRRQTVGRARRVAANTIATRRRYRLVLCRFLLTDADAQKLSK